MYGICSHVVIPLLTSNRILSPSRLPLSAFIAEDMNEFVHAHATYRFVIFDDEEERPRLLVRSPIRFFCFSVSDRPRSHLQIWLFKPSMRLSYAIPTQYVLAKSASIRAGKVLFKILDTATAYSDLDGYGIFELCVTIIPNLTGFP